MVVHGPFRTWTPIERERNYQFGMTYCARYGYEKFKQMGKKYLFTYFNLTSSLFFKFDDFFQNLFIF